MEEKSLAWELLQDTKKANKRMFLIWIITFLTLIAVTCYTIYLLNDIGTVEETTQEVSQQNESGNNNFVGNDGNIINGNAKNKKDNN
jgi:capsular polysaccharide biosynthesis protein